MSSTTFDVAASSDDGAVTKTGAPYPPSGATASVDTGGTAQSVYKYFDTPNYVVSNLLARWDTSIIGAGGVVLSASLRIYITTPLDSDVRDLNGEWYSGGNWPIDGADWTDAVGTTAFSTALAGLTGGAYVTIPLANLGSINTSGYTGMRLGISGGTPTSGGFTGAEGIPTYDHATLDGPQLIVTYAAVGEPYAVPGQKATNSGTSSTAITATLPSAPTPGDLLVAMVDCSGSVTPLPGSGWNKCTQVQSTDTGCIFWKQVTAGDTASLTLTSTGTGSGWTVAVQELANLRPSSPLDVEDNQPSTGTSKSSPSVTPTASVLNALIVGGAFSDGTRSYSSQGFSGSNVGAVTDVGQPTRGTPNSGESCDLWYAFISSTTGSYSASANCSAADGGGCAVAIFAPAGSAFKDASTRARLTAGAFKDVALRARFIARAFGNVATRVRILARRVSDVSTRTRLRAPAWRDAGVRVAIILSGATGAFKDVALRARLNTRGVRGDTALRSRLRAPAWVDTATRLALGFTTARDTAVRARVNAARFGDAGVRVRLIEPVGLVGTTGQGYDTIVDVREQSRQQVVEIDLPQ